jgi:hypothetical protein
MAPSTWPAALQPRLRTGAGIEGTGNLEALQSKAVRKLKGNDRLVLGQEHKRQFSPACDEAMDGLKARLLPFGGSWWIGHKRQPRRSGAMHGTFT